MRRYNQLSTEEREKLFELRQSQQSIAQIALAMGRHRSTIWRELKRNEAPPGYYVPDTAHHQALSRRKRGSRIDRHADLKDFIQTKLCCHYWTPEQIAGYIKNRQKELPSVSHETIYAWLYSKAQLKEKLWKFLPRHKARRGLRKSKGTSQSRIPDRVSIHQRPPVGRKRKIFGHWEADLVSFRKNADHILVLRERKTMFTQSSRLPSKKALPTAAATIDLLRPIPRQALKTVTYDNGTEFAKHRVVAQTLGIKTFFCDPYASWQKGGIENTNGRLRRDLPRKTNIHNMNQEDFDEIIDNYNNTPRKSLNWLTPLEAFINNLNRVALQT